MECDGLKCNYGGDKYYMSPGQSRHVSTDNRTLEEVGLLAAPGAECGQDN
jgi:hypothetical protein